MIEWMDDCLLQWQWHRDRAAVGRLSLCGVASRCDVAVKKL
jgi:hypothetical protein